MVANQAATLASTLTMAVQAGFDNLFRARLPGEAAVLPGTRAVQGAAWSAVNPTAVAAPRLRAHRAALLARIEWPSSEDEQDLADIFSGNRLVPGMQPIAACYGGHQFGHWAGQLGDGRAISLGEWRNSQAERFELQLKGAGPTPYSRRADGRAVLRSSIREFLCSEAMHALGVPTTRALTLVETGEPVVRDMFYDGRPAPEPGAIVCRVAPSFIRFGTFELPAARGDVALLKQLVDFCIERDFPHLSGANRIADWFVEIAERTAVMIAHWLRVGFVHGVMNTDNMSVLGLTLDYGPYGFLDEVDPSFTPNTTDSENRRYAFGRQVEMGHFNLACLARALSAVLPDPDALQAGLRAYADRFAQAHAQMLADKLGIDDWADGDFALARDLYQKLEQAQVDHTLFFRRLSTLDLAMPTTAHFAPAFYDGAVATRHEPGLRDWLLSYAGRVGALPAASRRARMDLANPKYMPRNYLAVQAIDAATRGDYSVLDRLLAVLERPYDEQPEAEDLAVRRPEWARHRAGCSMLSCSS